jgi:hypothetical protein
MINSGLMFEMLSYSFVESSFHRDKKRTKLYHSLMEKHFHADSVLLKEAIVFNQLLNARAKNQKEIVQILEQTFFMLPKTKELNKPYRALIKDLKKIGIMQEMEDVFANIDGQYGNVFSLINYVVEHYHSNTPIPGPLKKLLADHLKSPKVNLVEKIDHTFGDKIRFLSMAIRNDLSVDEESFIIEAFSSPKPIKEFLFGRFSDLHGELESKGKIISELGSKGKVAVGGAVVALVTKKLNDIKRTIEGTSRDQVKVMQQIQKSVEKSSSDAIRSMDKLGNKIPNVPSRESYVKAYADYKNLLTEMENIIGECDGCACELTI